MQERVQSSPFIEQQFKQLTRDYQTALEFYNDLLKKRDQSAMASDLERRQEGEEFRVLDAPNLPDQPSFPNRSYLRWADLSGDWAMGLVSRMSLKCRIRLSGRKETLRFLSACRFSP